MKNQLDPLVGREHRARARPAGALPPHQEQRRAHRRARRRQDRHRRRPGAEDRLRRRAALPRRQAHPRARHLADRRRHQVSRPVRRAPQGDHEGADREPEHHRVHRRAAHAGRRRIGGRLARRRQHPQAGAVARRDPLHRRDDAGRVPQVHREGPLARAPLPGDQGRSADREGDDRGPARREGPLRVVPSRRVHARTRSRRRSTSRAATSPTGSCPTRRSISSTRPARAPSCARPATARSSARSTSSIRVAVEQMENAVSEKNFEKAQFYREQEVQARENLQFVREKFDVKSSTRRVVVGKAEIDEVVSKWTGVPLTSINQDEERQAPAHGRGAAQPRHLAGEGDLRAVARDPPLTRRPQEPEPAGRQLRVPRSDRRRQDRARARARATSCSAATTR